MSDNLDISHKIAVISETKVIAEEIVNESLEAVIDEMTALNTQDNPVLASILSTEESDTVRSEVEDPTVIAANEIPSVLNEMYGSDFTKKLLPPRKPPIDLSVFNLDEQEPYTTKCQESRKVPVNEKMQNTNASGVDLITSIELFNPELAETLIEFSVAITKLKEYKRK